MFRKERGFIPHLKKGAGFTLIELLIVIAVIGILAATIIPRFIALDSRARDGVTKSNLSALRAAVVLHRSQAGIYMTTFTTLIPTYIDKIPPEAYVGGETAIGTITSIGTTVAGTAGGWVFLSDVNEVKVNTTGTDYDGVVWTSW